VQRNCNECGTAYQAQRPTSKFCSTRCRTRQTRKRQSGEVIVPLTQSRPEPVAGILADATRAELGTLADTADGILLLTLAARIDAVPETSPALATLSKEFAARKSDIMAHAPNAKANPFDELQALRERRRA
jgi:endogenous inhibitor of DNA gyrase (YacG/DUF329 family)